MQQKMLSFFAILLAFSGNHFAYATNRGISSADRGEAPAWPSSLFQNMALTHGVDWELRTAVSGVCALQRGGSGALLESLESYKPAERSLVSQTTGLGLYPQVIGLAQGSPAEKAGLEVAENIVSINGKATPDPDLAAAPASSGIIAIQEDLDGDLKNSVTRVSVLRDGKSRNVEYSPVRLCAGHSYVMIDNARRAWSDRTNVAVTTGLLSFLRSKDELAFVLGHELGHTIYKDSEKGALSRKTKEKRADLFAVFAMECAGYDRSAAGPFLARLGKSDWLSAIATPGHPSYGDRVKAVSGFTDTLPCDDPKSLDAITQKARS